ncbi:xylulose-5-phosphate/fructose-6-phosphate phosphoketolase [Oscillibacter sp. PC13]|uniref:phosphoketolase family protein n=1 Tax=Oscillibacter sp. PC13 TaxID=1855299 RepID=UPI0008EB5F2A|nr:phosphoketolase family protein [Oscillibacter sp. PC13]SFP20747.1 xylulose-5-phosphate/fructose-6-phosphate phosphoketolase [Oscillibacter sp. PC13]
MPKAARRVANTRPKANTRLSKRPLLTPDQLKQIDAYWRAANYLTACQLYLLDNPLLKRPLTAGDLKQTIVGHWGTCPGQNFIYTHLDRIIKREDLDMIYLSGPGHGGNAMIAQDWLDGSYTEVYPNITQDESGMQKLFKQFSFPGGVPSHVAPETPGSINEGGELGYSLAHAFGAVADNPDLIAACVVGDGEAETGPLATSWHSNKFLNPITDGAVLPILHLNGFKIANPTVFSRISHEELEQFFRGCGWEPRFVEGDDPEAMHQQMAATLDWAIREIQRIQDYARSTGDTTRPRWPVIILRTPKGWTGPKEVDGNAVEGAFRAHQVPISMGADTERHLPLLEQWLRSYHPEELFDEDGRPVELIRSFPPTGNRRMGANPHTNGGLLLRDLRTPDFRDYALDVPAPGAVEAQDMLVLGSYVRDVMKLNMDARNFRIFAPDETASNRLGPVFEVTGRRFLGERHENEDPEEHLDPDGRVMDSMLSEHMCEGWLEGYLLTGRHGFFNSYEAFIRIVDSMFAQHAKWLKTCNELPWRQDIASLNYILSSNVWQQDHNGFTHQDPGFLDHVANKKADVVRIYLPPDSNCLLSVFDHCIQSRNYVNVMVTSKHPRPQWLTMDQAVKHCTQGIGIWDWASNDQGQEPDVVMACCGDTPTLETLAAVTILRKELPNLKIRVINVVDLMKLQPHTEHPHGLTDEEYDMLFTKDKPIIFAYHGYPTLIHELTYRRHNKNLHVRGYKEEGTITTPFDMRVLNDIDRFHLVIDVVRRLPELGNRGAYLVQRMNDKLVEHKQYIKDHGVDLPEIREWKWNEGRGTE